MPNDRNKQPLAVGDIVYIECQIVKLKDGDNGDNCAVKTVSTGFPGSSQALIELNAGMVEKEIAAVKAAKDAETAALARADAAEKRASAAVVHHAPVERETKTHK